MSLVHPTDHPVLEMFVVLADGGDFGHDKSRAIRPYAALPADNRPILVYCGDGVSDISAARETDLLFAKKGRDLIKHCIIEGVHFYPFDVRHPPFHTPAWLFGAYGRRLKILAGWWQSWRAVQRRSLRSLTKDGY
jgi:hypothetical protein